MRPHVLNLKLGSLVNLNVNKGMCNDSNLIVKEICLNFIKADILTHPQKEETVSRIDIAPTEIRHPFTLNKRQFPIVAAIVITINKTQGWSFDKVGIFLRELLLLHEQLYVALTKIQSKENLKISLQNGEFVKKHLL